MNIALWIAQILLGLVFFISGIAKSTFSRQQFINTRQTGVVDLPIPLVRSIGIFEILGAVGLILPWLLGILPVLTPLSAMCLSIMMILAARKHAGLQEPGNVRNNIILLMICLFVAFGRLFA
jgi:uncharacterized membrane protein YphA (DoxX/SURF4 family)